MRRRGEVRKARFEGESSKLKLSHGGGKREGNTLAPSSGKARGHTRKEDARGQRGFSNICVKGKHERSQLAQA